MNIPYKIAANEYNYIIEKYSEVDIPNIEISEANYHEVLKFVHQILQLHYDECKEVAYRNRLHIIKQTIKDEAVMHSINVEIAKSTFRSGAPDAAMVLASEEEYKDRQYKVIQELEAAYGATLITESWNASRGNCLTELFRRNKEWFTSKKILHIAPEPELMAAFKGNFIEFDSYVTSDGYRNDVDVQEDLTTLDCFENESFDIVICHRVFEHIKNDEAAFIAIHRVLKPGGLLNHSVPQSMNMEKSSEWIVPDLTLHFHVRHYGRDYTDRIDACGFETELVDEFLSESVEALKAKDLFPMRLYNSWKR